MKTWHVRVGVLGTMAQKSAGSPWNRRPQTPTPREQGRQRHDRKAIIGGEEWLRLMSQCRDDGGRALRAVFSFHDNWPNLSEAERDEWRGYFDRMLEWLHHLSYTSEHNPCSLLLEGLSGPYQTRGRRSKGKRPMP
jgi:hypothetical protein